MALPHCDLFKAVQVQSKGVSRPLAEVKADSAGERLISSVVRLLKPDEHAFFLVTRFNHY
jgi:hypothetical protein